MVLALGSELHLIHISKLYFVLMLLTKAFYVLSEGNAGVAYLLSSVYFLVWNICSLFLEKKKKGNPNLFKKQHKF